MPRKSLTDRRAEKLAQLDAIKKDLAALELKAGERLGKLALKAGLADLALDDDTLLMTERKADTRTKIMLALP
jgi:hypothetical protein